MILVLRHEQRTTDLIPLFSLPDCPATPEVRSSSVFKAAHQEVHANLEPFLRRS